MTNKEALEKLVKEPNGQNLCEFLTADYRATLDAAGIPSTAKKEDLEESLAAMQKEYDVIWDGDTMQKTVEAIKKQGIQMFEAYLKNAEAELVKLEDQLKNDIGNQQVSEQLIKMRESIKVCKEAINDPDNSAEFRQQVYLQLQRLNTPFITSLAQTVAMINA